MAAIAINKLAVREIETGDIDSVFRAQQKFMRLARAEQ